MKPLKLRAGLYPPLGVLLLSTLWAFDWLLPDLFPYSGANTVSLPLRQAILFSAFAAMTTSIAVAQRLQFPRGRRAWACASIGVGLFVIPTSAAAFAQGWISNLDEVAVLCLTPVFAVVLEPYLQDYPPRRGRAALAASLAAIAGILLVFPLETPRSFRAGAVLFVLVIAAGGLAAANCIAVRLAQTFPGRSTLAMAALASAASAVCFAVTAAFTPSPAWNSSALEIYLLRLFLIDIPGLFLLFWLMSHLAASRMTARFLLAPLFASLASLALDRMSPPLRALIGIVLLAGGSGWLVFAPAESEVEELNPLKAIAAAWPDRPPREG
jgi:drug/metabolite transporter (DMT)-like permease